MTGSAIPSIVKKTTLHSGSLWLETGPEHHFFSFLYHKSVLPHTARTLLPDPFRFILYITLKLDSIQHVKYNDHCQINYE